MTTPAEMRAAGRAMTPEQLQQITTKFRTQIGGLYDFVAACIEQQHPHARVDETGYLELDSDRDFTTFLNSFDPLHIHPGITAAPDLAAITRTARVNAALASLETLSA